VLIAEIVLLLKCGHTHRQAQKVADATDHSNDEDAVIASQGSSVPCPRAVCEENRLDIARPTEPSTWNEAVQASSVGSSDVENFVKSCLR